MSGRTDGSGPTGEPARLTVSQLRGLLAGPHPPTVLDVRPARERAIGHLPGDRWIPLDLLPERLTEVPFDRPVVLYGHRARAGFEAAALLRRAGRNDVAWLEGGIDDYARQVDPTIPRYRDRLEEGLVVQQFPNPESGCLAYLVWDRWSRDAVVIDPGRATEPYQHELRSRGLALRGILETHTHADHLSGHAELHQRSGAPVLVGRRSGARYVHTSLSEGEAVEIGREEIVVWETPGHTLDHLSLRVRDAVFTGDTLLAGSCGRTDLADGDPELLWQSLHGRLLRLPDETEVFPAHYGPLHGLPSPERFSTSIGLERSTNEAAAQPDRESFLSYMREGWPPKPAEFEEIVRSNLDR